VSAPVELVRAANPGPFTLTGTNTWLVGAGPCWVVDPGPDLVDHREQILERAGRLGGIGGIVLTHDHGDHADGVPALAEAAGSPPVAAARLPADIALADGDEVGPFTVVATPGHAPDHLAFVAGRDCFTGDAVLGQGSVFVAPDPGALAGYLAGLRRLQALALDRLLPGHGDVVADPGAKLEDYLAHRADRERRLVAALAGGRRTVDELLDAAWDDVPAGLRGAATVTLAAHLDKLEGEGRLPGGVQRPAWG
jgi:glyoxylase-like metal-dependent hydrolase (beta-lactamase superfamily II)